MDQNTVRLKLKKLIKETGTTQTFVCKKLGIPASIMSLFINGKKDLYPETLEDLNNFIDCRME